MLFKHIVPGAMALVGAALIAACGGNGGNGDDPNGGDGATSTAASTAVATPDTAASPGENVSTVASGNSAPVDVADLDVCTLLTHDEVEAAIGQTAGPPAFIAMDESFASAGLGGGDCRFEADNITPVVSVSILAWADEEAAASSFDFGTDYPAVEGPGDRAKRVQPIGDISVLVGRYELSVDLYFVSEDDDEEFEMARSLAELVVSRLE